MPGPDVIEAAFPQVGRVAQRESTSLTWKGSQVRSLSRPPFLPNLSITYKITLPFACAKAGFRKHIGSKRRDFRHVIASCKTQHERWANSVLTVDSPGYVLQG